MEEFIKKIKQRGSSIVAAILTSRTPNKKGGFILKKPMAWSGSFLLLPAILVMIVCLASHCDKPVKPEQPNSTHLQGTIWKLESFVNEQTGAMLMLEPVDCDSCYTLKFDTDSTAIGRSCANEQWFNFNHTSIFLGSTKINDRYEIANLHTDLMFNIKSHIFANDTLYFYCRFEDIDYTLTYKKQERKNVIL